MTEARTTAPLADLQSVCADIYARWDSDMRSGKLLAALAGNLQDYDPRVTRILRALNAAPDLFEALRDLVDQCCDGDGPPQLETARAALSKAQGASEAGGE